MNKKIKYTFYSILASVAILPLLSSSFADEPTSFPGSVCKSKMSIKSNVPNVTEASVIVWYKNAKITSGTPCLDLGTVDKDSVIAVHFKAPDAPANEMSRSIADIPVWNTEKIDESTDLAKSTTKEITSGGKKYKVSIEWFSRGWLIDGTKKRQVVITELNVEKL